MCLEQNKICTQLSTPNKKTTISIKKKKIIVCYVCPCPCILFIYIYSHIVYIIIKRYDCIKIKYKIKIDKYL